MRLDAEATKSVAYTKKDTNQNELTVKKLKRILEVSSVICSAASINMIIACLYGFIPAILGFKSQEMIFDLAFSFLVASVVLGTFAMATSRIPDRKLNISFPAFRIPMLVSSILTSFPFFRKINTTGCEKPANTQPVSQNAEHSKLLKEKRSEEVCSNSLDNLSIKNTENAEYSLKNAGKSTVFSTSSDKSPETKSQPELQKCHTPFLFGHCKVTQSPNHFTKSFKFMQFDLEQVEKKSKLLPLLQQTFITNGHFNEVNSMKICEKHPQVGIVSPIKINNSSDVEYCDLYKNFSPSVESIRGCQNQPKKRFNPNNLVEQQNLYQNIGRMSNVKNNVRYESNASMKAFHEFPSSQREVFNSRLHTENLQNLHKVQNKFPKVRCHDSREIPCREFLQTLPESSVEFSSNRSGIGNFNLHNMKVFDSDDHYHKLRQKVTPNFKSFQHPLKDSKEALHSQIGKINPRIGWNIKSKKWGENFVERSDIPMEICDKSPNDQVLEVSMKLNDLNFMF